MTIKEIAERIGLSTSTVSTDRLKGIFDITDSQSIENYISTRKRKQTGRPLKDIEKR